MVKINNRFVTNFPPEIPSGTEIEEVHTKIHLGVSARANFLDPSVVDRNVSHRLLPALCLCIKAIRWNRLASPWPAHA